MSRTYHGGNSVATRALSGRQRNEPAYVGEAKETEAAPGSIHPALPVLASATSSMTKAKLLELIETATDKLGG